LCRRLGQNLGTFYRNVAMHPVLYVLPFAVCIAIGRWLYPSHEVAAIAACLTGATVLAVFYWRKVLPHRVKSSMFAVRTRVARLLAFSQAD
jgi:hypothetical protein